ncbi:exocyst complex component Sec10-like protein [Endogone sp. FLAS-F59071]|nr:exocyst complex component Sec10-like protein [Endogone sp. FLAS-F59071]|eukprot:RUS21835.1 exocyst complex component Sec10-like protein [Endogone sp. FLAS-F59071]
MSGPSRSRTPKLYDLDPEVRDLLNVDRFKGKFTSKDFVEALSKNLIEQARQQQTKAFDPKPFTRTFQNVIDELVEIRNRVQERCEDLEDATQLAEAVHKKKVQDLAGTFEDVYQSFENLETRINEVGNTAIRIGEQLETIDRQRSRASEGRDLVEYFMEFNEGGSERLEWLRTQGGTEGQHKAAIVARRLNAISKDMDLPGGARDGIEKLCESLEKDLLRDFDRAYKDGDPRTMAHCAKILQEFNGGHSCVQIYVNQHEFFISNIKVAEVDEIRYSEDHQELSNPLRAPPDVDTSLLKLYDEIRMTVRREAEIIAAVFPDPGAVMQVFLQRVFAQSIQSHIELLLQRAEKQSHLAYLRTLASTHAETARLVDSLKTYCEKETRLFVAVDTTVSSAPSIAVTLDRCFEDLFVPYTEGDRYVDRERQGLVEVFTAALSGFTATLQQRKKGAKGPSALARAFNQISSATSSPNVANVTTGAIPASPRRDGFDAATIYSNPGGSNSSSNLVAVLSGPTDEDVSLPSAEVTLRILRMHAEAVTRSVELTDSQDLARVAGILFNILLEFIGTRYVDVALENAIDDLDVKSEPDLKAMFVIKAADDIIHLVQQHFQSAILPLVVSSPTIHRDIVNSKNAFMTNVENKANSTMQKEIDAITNWLNIILAKQKKNDFRPKDDDILVLSLATQVYMTANFEFMHCILQHLCSCLLLNILPPPFFFFVCVQPCNQSVDFLKKVHSVVLKVLDGKNLEVFLTEIGNMFHAMMLDHFRKFVVSASGGLLLSKDIAKYQEAIQLFKLPSLNDRFEMLRQLGNVFLVRPEMIKIIISEGYLARLDHKALAPYLEMRADYKSAKIDQLVGILEGGEGGEGDGTIKNVSKGHRRLSAFMRDNKVMRDLMERYSSNKEFLLHMK